MAKKKFNKLAVISHAQVEQPVVEALAEDEGCDTSILPETSQSVSKTLGTEDTQSYAKVDVTADQVKEDFSKKSFASLFKDNRNPSKGISLFKVESQEDVVEIEYDEVDDVIETWGYALAGYVDRGFPGTATITWLTSSWKITNKFHVHKSSCLVFCFDNKVDRDKILDGDRI